MKKVKKLVYLPLELKSKIELLELSKTELNYCYLFLDLLCKKSIRRTGFLNSFIELPVAYIRKISNGNYKIWITKLESAKIIKINKSYSNKDNNNYPKSYSIILNNLSPSIMLPPNQINPLFSISYDCKNEDFSETENKLKNEFISDFKKLKIDYDVMYNIAESEVENLTIDSIKIDEAVGRKEFNVLFKNSVNERLYWMKKEMAIEKANKNGMSLIEDNGSYYIMNKHDFIYFKKLAMLKAYNDSITNIKKGMLYGNRNSTNNRFDTNLTNMYKPLTDYICEKNDLVQFDMANAQFSLFCHLYGDKFNSEDFEVFKNEAYKGTLYTYIQDKLELKSRKEAKITAFELLFSKETYNSELKTKLKNVFPNVVSFIDEYKKEQGYKNFSISLQQKEAEIFIDGIYKNLKAKRLFTLTKHDCVIVRRKDVENVREIVDKYFNRINFLGKIVEE